MANFYKKFTFKDSQGKIKVFEVDRRDYKNFLINIAECAFTQNIGPVYVFDEEINDWRELDYYNDV